MGSKDPSESVLCSCASNKGCMESWDGHFIVSSSNIITIINKMK